MVNLVDLQYLQQRFKQDQLREIFNSFVNETTPALTRIMAAIEARDRQALSEQAHRLKGTSATLTANVMSNLARELEETAKHSDWQAAKILHQRLEKSFLELKNLLKEHGILESLDV